jgi:hypothetical protein
LAFENSFQIPLPYRNDPRVRGPILGRQAKPKTRGNVDTGIGMAYRGLAEVPGDVETLLQKCGKQPVRVTG